MKVYIVFNHDYDTGWEIYNEDTIFSPKAFLKKTAAEVFVKEKGYGDIFEYEVEDFDEQAIEDCPRIREFRKFVAGLECTKDDPILRRFSHAITGIGTEAGELLTEMKKTVFYGIHDGKIDMEKVGDESCDLFHYLVMLTNMLGISFDRLIELNTVKLEKRFPDGYSKESWLNRDKDVEKKAMREVDVLEDKNLGSVSIGEDGRVDN